MKHKGTYGNEAKSYEIETGGNANWIKKVRDDIEGRRRGARGASPARRVPGHSSLGRLERLAEFVPRRIPDGFNPACISWVTDRVGITAEDGVDEALELGCFVINVAGEIDNGADVKLPIEPGSGTVRERLDEIVQHMRQAIDGQGREVVVHCAMGMERSVLSVVWYLNVESGMTIDEAYDMVFEARPIACDRRHWING